MDTNENNRDTSRQRRSQQSGQSRSGAAGESPSQPRRTSPQKSAPQTSRQQTRPAERQREPQRRTAQPGNQSQNDAAQRGQQTAQRRPSQTASRQQTGQKRPAAQTRQTAQKHTASSRGTAASRKRTPKRNPLRGILSVFGRGGKKASGVDASKRRQEQRAAEAQRKRRQAARHNTPAVIYTSPMPFNRNRLLIQLITVTAVVLALIMGLSIFFKVEVITVSGAEIYSAWTVREASGISEGNNLLTFGRTRASGQIIAKLPYVKSARIGIKLPNTVNIYIEEYDVAYAIKAENGTWWLINSDGGVVEQTDGGTAGNYTNVLGVTLTDPKSGEQAVATEDLPTETDESGEYIPVTVTGAQRLNAVLQILRALEDNDIVGEAASVDVSRLDDIILWYGTRYQVNLGDISQMSYKIACMNDAILQLSEYQTGVLDVSFTIWPDQVGYTPFE